MMLASFRASKHKGNKMKLAEALIQRTNVTTMC